MNDSDLLAVSFISKPFDINWLITVCDLISYHPTMDAWVHLQKKAFNSMISYYGMHELILRKFELISWELISWELISRELISRELISRDDPIFSTVHMNVHFPDPHTGIPLKQLHSYPPCSQILPDFSNRSCIWRYFNCQHGTQFSVTYTQTYCSIAVPFRASRTVFALTFKDATLCGDQRLNLWRMRGMEMLPKSVWRKWNTTEWWGLSGKLHTLWRWRRTEDCWDYATYYWNDRPVACKHSWCCLLSSHGKGRKPCVKHAVERKTAQWTMDGWSIFANASMQLARYPAQAGISFLFISKST